MQFPCYQQGVLAQDIVTQIVSKIPDAKVEMRDLTGGGDHWEAVIISAEFEGKSLIEQHRLVFDALAEEMKGPIHALALKTFTPQQTGS